jgi:hypothetical protein
MIDVSTHPEIARIQREVVAAENQKRVTQQMEEAERARLRTEQGKYLRKHVKEMIELYQDQRQELHEIVGRVWFAEQAYRNLTGVSSSEFSEETLLEISLPTLLPSNNWNIGFTTTRQAVSGYYSDRKWGKA